MTKPSTTQETRELEPHSPLPWGVHRTGSHIGLLSADRKYVFRKVVSGCSIEQYNKLSADLEFIAAAVNAPSATEQVRLREALEMIVCNVCGNRIGWTEPFTPGYGRTDWAKCSSCRPARAALQPKAETEGEQEK